MTYSDCFRIVEEKVKPSSHFSVFMNDSQVALSQGLPRRDMLICTACVSNKAT